MNPKKIYKTSALLSVALAATAVFAQKVPSTTAKSAPAQPAQAAINNSHSNIKRVTFVFLNAKTGKEFACTTDEKGNGKVCNMPSGTYKLFLTPEGGRKVECPSDDVSKAYEVLSPRDLASGQASGKSASLSVSATPGGSASAMSTGKRMHKPFVITKELDRMSATVTQVDACVEFAIKENGVK